MDNIRFFNGEKFLWDGGTHENEQDSEKIKAEYESNNFETRLIHEDGKFFLFTRRVVTEVVVDQQ